MNGCVLIVNGMRLIWCVRELIEVNNDNVSYREIILSKDCYHVSALEDCLAEGEFVDEEIESEIKDITQTEFEQIWDDALREHSEKWGEIKNKINTTYVTFLIITRYDFSP